MEEGTNDSNEDNALAIIPSSESAIDLTSHFQTQSVFPSRDELIAWARNVGRSLCFVVTIQSSDKLTGRPRPRVILGCDRAGFVRESQNRKGWVKQNLRKTTTKKCGCPFTLKGQKDASVDEWRLEVLCGTHNHKLSHLEAHSYAGRLNEKEEKLVEVMYASGVKPRKILSALKKEHVGNTTTMRTIYNQRVALHKKELDGLSQIQFLYKCITAAGYVSFNAINEHTKQLKSLFFAHPTSIKLSCMFSYVFLLDCTYKTNRYRMPLLSIAGMTSTSQSFFSTFTFMSDELETSYIWALNCFKSSLDASAMPMVFITDRELALMNAIKVVFPQAKNILCQVHIHRNILAHCKKYFSKGKECEIFLGVWQRIVNARTENEFNIEFIAMSSTYAEKFPNVFKYVVSTWVDPYKEYFVCAWVDKFLHLGNTTTNRVEGGHSQLKKFLEVSVGNLQTVWRTFDQMIYLQHTDIKRSFGHSTIQSSPLYMGSLYTALVGRISLSALAFIKEEEARVKSLSYTIAGECTHKVRYSMGLPCAHELVPYINDSSSFPLYMVHKQWRQLSFEEDSKSENVDDITNVFEGICRRSDTASSKHKEEIKRKLREIMEPTSSQTLEPKIPIKLKGRPKGTYKKLRDDPKSTKRNPSHFEYVLQNENDKQELCTKKKIVPKKRTSYLFRKPSLTITQQFHIDICRQMPPYIADHIMQVINVLGDGHCGYRAISHALDMGENWAQVRLDLIKELQVKEDMYMGIYGVSRYAYLLASLDCSEIPAPLEKWMSMPDMGLVIASHYNIALVQLSTFQSLTFLPLNTAPPTSPQLVCIGFIDGDHFVHMVLRDGCPLPRIVSPWRRFHDLIAKPWEDIYISRMVISQHQETKESDIVNLDNY